MGIEFPPQKPNKKTNTPIIGSNWAAIQKNSGKVNTVFDFNQDGKIQDNEYTAYKQSENQGKTLSKDEAYLYLNPDDYTTESLNKRYPPNKYEIKINREYNYSNLTIVDKSTGKKALEFVTLYEKGYPNHQVREFDKKGEEVLFRVYDKNNKIQRYDDKDGFHYPIMNLIHEDICAKTKIGLPTTGKDFEKHIKLLDKDNITVIIDHYRKNYGQTLEDAINNEIGLDANIKRRILGHITDCLEQANGYKKNGFTKESVVNNEYHTGDAYTVTQKGSVLTAVNKKTGKVSKLNLYDMCKDLPLDKKVAIKAAFQRLPGEVIADFVSEGITKLKSSGFLENLYDKAKEKITGSEDLIQAYYHPGSDSITIINRPEYFSINELVHELGHAIDCHGRILNTYSSGKGSSFYDVFQKDLAAYKKAGYQQYQKGDIRIFSNDVNMAYATSDNCEMFAECYTLLTTGRCNSEDAIKEYFKNTLKEAEKLLKQIRNFPDNKRHAIKIF